MKPIHAHRQGTTTTKRRKAHGAAVEYAPGFFTEDIRAHDWPPSFVSVGRWTSLRHAAPHVISAQSRGNQGFDSNPLGLPGAKVHVTQWEARKAQKAAP